MARPKLIQKHYEPEDKSTRRIYQYPSGLKLVHYLLPGMTEFSASISVKAGKFYETQVGVPQGTAHFLEHILGETPNSKLKTKDAAEIYKAGNKRKSWITENASTSINFAQYYGFAPAKGSERLLNFLNWEMEHRSHRFAEVMEQQRSIILNEMRRRPPETRDSGLIATRFITENKFPDQVERVVGTEDSIKAITLEDIKKYYDQTYTTSRTVIGIQSGEPITSEQWKILNELAAKLERPDTKELVDEPRTSFKNSLKYFHFTEEKASNTNMSIVYRFVDHRNNHEYEASKQIRFSMQLIRYLIYKVLREELGIVYSVDQFNYYPISNAYVIGFKLSFAQNELTHVLDQVYNIFNVRLKEFAQTKRAKAWLDDVISSTIFPSQPPYNRSAVDEITRNLLTGFETFSRPRDSKKAIAGIKLENLLACATHMWENCPPLIWIDSNTDGKEIISELKQSQIYKHWENIPEIDAPEFTDFGQKFYTLN